MDWSNEELKRALKLVNYYNMISYNQSAWNCEQKRFNKLNKAIFEDLMFTYFMKVNKLVPVMNSYVGIQQCQDQINYATWRESSE